MRTSAARASISDLPLGEAGPWRNSTLRLVFGALLVGYYDDSNLVTHGFERHADGTIKTFDPKGSTATLPNNINKGMTTGSYNDNNNMTHGFIRGHE